MPETIASIRRARSPVTGRLSSGRSFNPASCFSILFRVSSRTGASGSLNVSPHFFMSESAHLAGAGLDSQKFISIRGRYFRWSRRASVQSPSRAARTRALMSRGISLETTEINPRPPSAMSASAVESSPEKTRKSSGSAVISRAILPKLPEASFRPTIRGISVRRRIVSTSRSEPVRPGTL